MQRTVAVVTLAVALALLVAGAGRGTEAKAGRSEFARHPPVSADAVADLARAGGKLWMVDGCQVSVVSLTTLTIKRAAGAHCQVWPNPSGTLAVATIGSPSSLAVNRRLAVLDARGTSLRQIAEIDHPQGTLSSPVAWASDTDLSFCVASESGPIVFTSTEASGWHLTQADPGRCLPQYDGARKFETEGASVLAQRRAGRPHRQAGRGDAADARPDPDHRARCERPVRRGRGGRRATARRPRLPTRWSSWTGARATP